MTPIQLTSAAMQEIRTIAAESFDTLWSERDFLYFLSHPCCFAYGLWDESGRLESYLLALLIQGELDIISLATRPDFRRKGRAEILVRFAISQTNVRRLLLEVDVENEPARKLYEKLGFSVRGIRRGYYDQKRDAYRMNFEKEETDEK